MSRKEKPALPKNWPPDLPYLKAPIYSKALTPSHISTLRTKPPTAEELPSSISRGPSPLVRITPITAADHPAHGQAGLFAAKDLKPGSFIVQYLGVIHASTPIATAPQPQPQPQPSSSPQPPPDPHATSDYDLSLDRASALALDAALSGNEARFVNDYRGVAARPNAEFREVWDAAAAGRRGERGMAVFALGGKGREKGIRRGEEIVVSYGRGFWGARRAGEADVQGRDGES